MIVELFSNIYAAWITAALGWAGLIFLLREKIYLQSELKKAEASEKKQEAVLAAALERADAPFFEPSAERREGYSSIQGMWPVEFPNVLHPGRATVPGDLPAGSMVVLPLANQGELPRHVEFSIDAVELRFIRYERPDGKLCGLIEYPFDPAQLGKRQVVEVLFESQKAIQRFHLYETVHGSRHFRRIDPPLPARDANEKIAEAMAAKS